MAWNRFECACCGHLNTQHEHRGKCRWSKCECTRVIATITHGEYLVLKQLATGETVKDAARHLDLSPKTVEAHAYNMRRRLDLHTTLQLVLSALRSGVLTLNDLPETDALVAVRNARGDIDLPFAPGGQLDRRMTPSQNYTAPSVAGITFATGQGTQQELPAGSLCTEADALFIQGIFGGTLVNAADYPALEMTFEHLDPASADQPWYLIGIVGPGFVGPRIVQMNGTSTKGTWSGIGTGNPAFTPDPPPPPVPQPVSNSSNDAADFAQMEGVTQPGTSTAAGAALTAAEAAELSHIEKMDEAILQAERIPDPGN